MEDWTNLRDMVTAVEGTDVYLCRGIVPATLDQVSLQPGRGDLVSWNGQLPTSGPGLIYCD